MHIVSLQNERVKQVVRLRDSARQRRRERLMVVEGRDEISLALGSGAKPTSVYCAPDLTQSSGTVIEPASVTTVAEPVFRKMSYRASPDGWLAVFPIPERMLSDVHLGVPPFLVIAETVEKPGNLGAVLRTADAAGVNAVVVCDPQTDLSNPNVVRASRGTVFTMQTAQAPSSDVIAWLRANGIRIVAACPDGATELGSADLGGPVAVVVGGEHEGLSEKWLAEADMRVSIPMVGCVNSLNVSVAAAVIVYEVVRQRRSSTGRL